MKKLFSFLLIAFVVPIISLAQQLEIHHVNIGNGDCTIIAIKDSTGAVVSKILIDGGNSNAATYLIPYINQEFGGNTYFTCVILSHFHKDHYNGLLAISTGAIRTDNIIDDGFYTIAPGAHNVALQPPNMAFPPPKAPGVWETAVSNYGNNVNNNVIRPNFLTNFPTNIGGTVTLGTIKGVPVTLRCIAANGWNTGAGGNPVNNITNGRNNQNNYSIGWVLTYGKFRYYTAGDIGGYNANYYQDIPYNGGTLRVNAHCAAYTNQETSIAAGMQTIFPNAQPINGGNNVAGHVCAVKISHHGSSCSNNTTWLGTLRPTAFFTSAGSNGSWKLPKLNTLYNMSQVQPVTAYQNRPWGVYNQGYYFTNLYNFTNQPSLAYAAALFSNRANTNSNYGNNNVNTNGSYAIVVPWQNITNYSNFQVWRVNCPFNNFNGIPQHELLATYVCHQ